MKITFVLPGFSAHPIGGFKIVYEYASRLQDRGHQVTVVHPRRVQKGYYGVIDEIKRWLWPLKLKIKYGARVPWFETPRGVRILLVPYLDEKFIPNGDAIFATAWHTAPSLAELSLDKGVKFYLIQHYETWAGPKEEVDATWKMPFHKIVIAKWLFDIGVQFGETSRMTYIPNALDFKKFCITKPIEQRNPFQVSMLYHVADWKGSADGINALKIVKKEFPQLQATLFGVSPRGQKIPEWMDYKQDPSPEELLDIYNHSSIFLHPSWTEGWPLPPAESMACGCALVAAGNPGVMDYTEDGKTALLSPVKNSEKLAENLIRLLKNNDLRLSITKAGYRHIRNYTWDKAISRMEETLKTVMEKQGLKVKELYR